VTDVTDVTDNKNQAGDKEAAEEIAGDGAPKVTPPAEKVGRCKPGLSQHESLDVGDAESGSVTLLTRRNQ
jgi:hypothetical protein